MFEKFTSLHSRDFQQRYHNTYGFYVNKKTSSTVLVKLIDIGRSVVLFNDKDGMEYRLRADAEEDIGFSFIPPKSGWHNTSLGGVLVRRVPARQWSRGICSKNTSIGTPLMHRYDVDFDMLAKIFVEKTAFDKALAAFQKKSSENNSFLALSEQFSISYASKKLYCFDIVIGEWEEVEGIHKVKLEVRELWQQEVRDAFSRRSMKVELV